MIGVLEPVDYLPFSLKGFAVLGFSFCRSEICCFSAYLECAQISCADHFFITYLVAAILDNFGRQRKKQHLITRTDFSFDFQSFKNLAPLSFLVVELCMPLQLPLCWMMISHSLSLFLS
jgi:hypothetical protein